MSPARHLLIEFVLERSAEEPVRKRIQLYRALAADLPERSAGFRSLTKLADDLEAIETSHDQLLLDLRRSENAR